MSHPSTWFNMVQYGPMTLGYTGTQSHGYTGTRVQGYTGTQSHGAGYMYVARARGSVVSGGAGA